MPAVGLLPRIGRVYACRPGGNGRRLWRCLVRSVAIYPSECRPGLQRARGHHCGALEDLLDSARRSRSSVSDSRRRRVQRHRFFTVAVSRRRDPLRRHDGRLLLSIRPARPLRDLEGGRPVRAVHSLYGVLSGGSPSHVGPPDARRGFVLSPREPAGHREPHGPGRLAGAFTLPGSTTTAMWPTNGLCVSDSAPTGVSFSPLDPSTAGFPPDGPLTDSGIYCVAVNPVP